MVGVMKELRITVDDEGKIEVWQGDKTTGLLTVGEMIEQIFGVLFQEKSFPVYPMDTPEGWKQEREARIAGLSGK